MKKMNKNQKLYFLDKMLCILLIHRGFESFLRRYRISNE